MILYLTCKVPSLPPSLPSFLSGHTLCCPIVLRVRYAMCGSDICYAATRAAEAAPTSTPTSLPLPLPLPPSLTPSLRIIIISVRSLSAGGGGGEGQKEAEWRTGK
eukprot:3629526-Rhodomonas_salina.1